MQKLVLFGGGFVTALFGVFAYSVVTYKLPEIKADIQLSSKSFSNKPLIDSNYTQITENREIWIKDKLSKMTLEEKIAQMFIFKAQGISMTPGFQEFLTRVKPGGVILMGDNISDNLAQFTKDIQATNSNLPLFISIDQEGGLVKRIQTDPNPGERKLSTVSSQEFCDTYSNTAQLLKSKGVNLNFGIVADIGWDSRSFIYPRTFVGNPDQVSAKVNQAIKCSRAVFSTIKHFPGHGRTIEDSHKKVPIVNLTYDEWLKTDAIPFKNSFPEQPDFVMVGQLNYQKIDNAPATLSKIEIDNLRKLGFEGITITDDMNMLADAGRDPTDSLIKAFEAGIDIQLYVSSKLSPEVMIQKLVELVRKGVISENRVNESLIRLLSTKYFLTSWFPTSI